MIFKKSEISSIHDFFKPLITEVKNFRIFLKVYYYMLKKGKVSRHYEKRKEFIHKRRRSKYLKIKRRNLAKKRIYFLQKINKKII